MAENIGQRWQDNSKKSGKKGKTHCKRNRWQDKKVSDDRNKRGLAEIIKQDRRAKQRSGGRRYQHATDEPRFFVFAVEKLGDSWRDNENASKRSKRKQPGEVAKIIWVINEGSGSDYNN